AGWLTTPASLSLLPPSSLFPLPRPRPSSNPHQQAFFLSSLFRRLATSPRVLIVGSSCPLMSRSFPLVANVAFESCIECM
ncbi:hypothetical protein FB45DRAFT_917130, partial [Roridomyces roridus]